MSGWCQVIPQLPGNAPSRTLQGIPAEFESGVEEVHQVSVLINDSVLLTGLFCSSLGAPRGRGQVVNRLVLLPSTELISYLYPVLRRCHGRSWNGAGTEALPSFAHQDIVDSVFSVLPSSAGASASPLP